MKKDKQNKVKPKLSTKEIVLVILIVFQLISTMGLYAYHMYAMDTYRDMMAVLLIGINDECILSDSPIKGNSVAGHMHEDGTYHSHVESFIGEEEPEDNG